MRSALVAICCNQPIVFTETARSLMELGWGSRIPYAKDTHGFDEVVHAWYTSGPRVDMLRNQACKDAVRGRPMTVGGERVPFTHLVFLDADMIWPTTVIHDLLAHHNKGIVAGTYFLKSAPYSPVHLKDRYEAGGLDVFYRIMQYGTDLLECDVVGMGCTIIPVSALTAIGESHWFEYREDQFGMPRVSEDVPFCLKAKAAGIPILMDPNIQCGHVTTQTITNRHHDRYQQSIEASKGMGPTVEIKEPDDGGDHAHGNH